MKKQLASDAGPVEHRAIAGAVPAAAGLVVLPGPHEQNQPVDHLPGCGEEEEQAVAPPLARCSRTFSPWIMPASQRGRDRPAEQAIGTRWFLTMTLVVRLVDLLDQVSDRRVTWSYN